MRPFKRALERVRNLLIVISDPACQSHVVLGSTETDNYVGETCNTHRCVLGWYNHLYRRDNPHSYSPDHSASQFGIDKATYYKIFGTGSNETEDPTYTNFDEDKTRREMRKRIKVIDEVLAGT